MKIIFALKSVSWKQELELLGRLRMMIQPTKAVWYIIAIEADDLSRIGKSLKAFPCCILQQYFFANAITHTC